jgi:hypothetical protein
MHRRHQLLLALALLAPVVHAAEPVGGRWSLEPGHDKPRYLFRDADRTVDPFSYHQSDSNQDGTDEVRLRHEPGFLVIESQGWPNHPTASFPNSGNPNSIRVQEFTFRLPLEPRPAAEITRLPMGPIGVALNGVVFFNPFEQGGMNAVEGYSEVWLDSCCGHPQQTGVYHYHKYPTCVRSSFADDGKRHSPVIGGYRGVPEPSNNRGLRRLGTGAIANNAEGESRMEAVIAEVRPGGVARGGRREVTLVLDPAQATRGPIPDQKPAWVQFGPYEAVEISRTGNTVTVAVDVPADASLGTLLDCHLEFEVGPRVRAVKKNDVLRIVE